MGSLNKTLLIGRVGKDPEIARLQNGKSVAKFSIATSESWKDQSGERQERTTWHNIVCFSEGLNKVIESYVKKGSLLYIEGSIANRSYEKDGQTRYVSEIVLQGFNAKLVMLDSRNDSQGDKAPDNSQNSYTDQSNGSKSYAGDIDSEIPFGPEVRA